MKKAGILTPLFRWLREVYKLQHNISAHVQTQPETHFTLDEKYFETILRCTHTTGPSTFDPKSAVPWYTVSSGMVGRGVLQHGTFPHVQARMYNMHLTYNWSNLSSWQSFNNNMWICGVDTIHVGQMPMLTEFPIVLTLGPHVSGTEPCFMMK